VIAHWWNRQWGTWRMDVHVEHDAGRWTVAIREGADYTGRWTYDSEQDAYRAAEHLLATGDTSWYDITAAYLRSM